MLKSFSWVSSSTVLGAAPQFWDAANLSRFRALPARVLLCVSRASRISFLNLLARCAFRARRAAAAGLPLGLAGVASRGLLDIGMVTCEGCPAAPGRWREERSGAAPRLLGGTSGVRRLAPGAYGAFPACSRAPKAPRRASAISGFGFGLDFRGLRARLRAAEASLRGLYASFTGFCTASGLTLASVKTTSTDDAAVNQDDRPFYRS